jgi:hypothetical protein
MLSNTNQGNKGKIEIHTKKDVCASYMFFNTTTLQIKRNRPLIFESIISEERKGTKREPGNVIQIFHRKKELVTKRTHAYPCT